MRSLTVTAIGRDRPGIIAGVTEVFFRLGCNLADCSMTRLSDQFAMILLTQAPADVTAETLRGALEGPGREFGLSVTVVEAPHVPSEPARRPFVLSVYGADRPGIVFHVTSELARRRINITDLLSRIGGDDIYSLVLEVDLAPEINEGALALDLRAIAERLKVDLTLRPAEAAEL